MRITIITNQLQELFKVFEPFSSYGDKTPKGPIARFLAVVWIIISTVFLALFTANATTILQISQAEEDHSITLGKKVIFVYFTLGVHSDVALFSGRIPRKR